MNERTNKVVLHYIVEQRECRDMQKLKAVTKEELAYCGFE